MPGPRRASRRHGRITVPDRGVPQVPSPTVRLNLTHQETRLRARLLEVDSYDIHLDLTQGDTRFESATTVRFRCTEAGASTFVDLVSDSVDSIELNGRALDPAEVFDGARITLTDLEPDNVLRVRAQCR